MRGMTLEQLIDELHLLRLETSGIDPKIGFDSEVILYKVFVKYNIVFTDKNLKKAIMKAIKHIKENRLARGEKSQGKDYNFKQNK